ncbi:hypothetical protein AMTR_s00001p00257680 [Amborella trichopoda]|uniref:Uncharacterized protein n=1 Tax=Amborella trichopoda TaxID=13333 RepID=W1NMF8_AMBTC|nr:hypothetical protein AMTR_s00001p00257680 [Amborella trichopoda]
MSECSFRNRTGFITLVGIFLFSLHSFYSRSLLPLNDDEGPQDPGSPSSPPIASVRESCSGNWGSFAIGIQSIGITISGIIVSIFLAGDGFGSNWKWD